MFRFLRKILVPSTVAMGTILASRAAVAAPVVVEGDVPADGPDHFYVDFDVPAGIEEIEIKHDDLSEANVLDFGVNDPSGYRGWGGGTSEPTIIAKTGASRAYLAGPITPGKWRVVIGKAKVVESPARYKLEIDLRATQTIASTEGARKPYEAPAARKKETRYYAGDLHVHSKESTDAKPTIEENIAFAKTRGLDFIEQSDHNTITQLEFYGPIQDKEPDFLLLPGIEYTTYGGHVNAIGATKWVEHKIGIDANATIAAAADAVAAQGAIFSVNHPAIDIGDLCIGCKWAHEIDPKKVGGVEIATLGLSNGGSLFSGPAIAFWDGLLDKGSHAAAIGGSDDHSGGVKGTGLLSSQIGSPTTLVRADELSVAAILDGIKKGRTVVKMDGPDDPMAELDLAKSKDGEALGYPGDSLGVRSILVRVKVTKGQGNQLRLVKNGVPLDSLVIDADPFVHTLLVEGPATEERWRAEVLVDDKPRTVTSHVWLKLDAAGPQADGPPAEDDGCRTTRTDASTPATIFGAAVLVAAGLKRRRRR